MAIIKNNIEIRNLNEVDEKLIDKLCNDLNLLINKNFRKTDLFEKNKLKIVVQGEDDRRFGGKFVEKEKTIFIPSWLFELTEKESNNAIFDFKKRVLLKEMIHYVDSELRFSSSKKFLVAMKQERIDTINYKINSFFKLAYLASFWIRNGNAYNNIATREQWEEMVETCNNTYFESISRIMKIWQKWKNKNKEGIPVKPAEKIIAREYLFDLILAKNAFEIIKKDEGARGKLESISDAWKSALLSYCKHIKFDSEESIENIFKKFIPKSYDCLLEFEDRINGGQIKLESTKNNI